MVFRGSATSRELPEQVAPRALIGWVLFDWATQPFYTLVVTFLFAPYFVNGFMSDPVTGQALWGYATGAAELVAALLAPVLGAIADAGGKRKPCLLGTVGGGFGRTLACNPQPRRPRYARALLFQPRHHRI
jgi:MFS-type transporter involved in bile tolerance (Atg22 family)